MAEPIYVAALGASTPLGRDAPSSAAAVRAGISGFAEHPEKVDAIGVPVRMALAPWLDLESEGVERFEALLIPAVEQALEPLLVFGDPSVRVALALGLPAGRPGLPEDLEQTLRDSLVRWSKSRFSAVASFPVGHAAGLLALRAATLKMSDHSFDACIVAGVDSYMSRETLDWFETNDQLHGAGPLNNAWGFIPGEGAGALLLLAESALARLGVEPFCELLGVGTAFEPKGIKSREVCIGEGLTSAFRAALGSLPNGARVTDVYCDMNGEPYRADEFGFACLRTKEAFESASDFVAPADCWGDVSAASAPLGIALSAIASRESYCNGRHAFVWCSSEGGERGAALLAQPKPRRD